MTAMILKARRGTSGPIDLAGITPDRLASLDGAGIGELPLADGAPLGDVFDVTKGDPLDLVIHAGDAKPLRAGAGMRSGRLIIEGDAGDFAGQAMRGGTLIVTGNAGNYAGGPLPGDRRGMRGGVLAILGDAGERAGERMRRGLILVSGNAGPWAGANMLAGTLAVAGECDSNPGFGLRRGSLVLLRPPSALPATFNDGGTHEFLFLTLLDRHLRDLGAPIDRFPRLERRMRRYSGDLACGGAGEILVPA